MTTRTRPAGWAAGALTVGVAGLLGLTWYDDGRTTRRGPAVLAPITDRPDDVPGLGWVRLAAVLAVLAVLAAAVALLRREAPPDTGGPRLRDPVTLLPVALPEPAGGRVRRAGWWAAALAVVAASACAVAAVRLGGRGTAAVPAVAVLLAGAAACWLLATVRHLPRRTALAVPAAIAVVAALTATLGGPWWTEGRFVERSTSSAPPPAAATGGAGPATPGRVLWSRKGARQYAAGGYVLLAEDVDGPGPRLAVLDAATGRERWSYRHTDAYLNARMDPAAGVLVVSRDRDGSGRILAFDLPTGRPLWTRSDRGRVLDDGETFDGGARLLPPGLVLVTGRERLTALDPRTGEQRWDVPDVVDCPGGQSVTRAGDLLVLTGICRSTEVTALRADTGERAWTTTISGTPQPTRRAERPPLVAGGAVLFTVRVGDGGGPERLVAVDLADGRQRWSRPTVVGVLPSTVVGGRFVTVESGVPTAGGRRAVTAAALDPATGRPVWTVPLPADEPAGDVRRVAGSDGQRLYVLSARTAGGPGSVRLAVVDAAGRLAGTAAFAGCEPTGCAGDRVGVTGVSILAASGGTLTVLSSSGLRPAVALGDGPAFTATG